MAPSPSEFVLGEGEYDAATFDGSSTGSCLHWTVYIQQLIIAFPRWNSMSTNGKYSLSGEYNLLVGCYP